MRTHTLSVITMLGLAASGLGCIVGVEGSGRYIEEVRPLAGFSEVTVDGALRVDVTAGQDFRVVAHGDDNIVPHLHTRVTDGRLEIWDDIWVIDGTRVGVTVNLPRIDRVDVDGASSAFVAGVAGQTFSADVSGASDLTAAGTASRLSLGVSGASRAELGGLTVESATIDVSGASSLRLGPAQTVGGEVSGASSVRLAPGGSATLTVSGASSVRRDQ